MANCSGKNELSSEDDAVSQPISDELFRELQMERTETPWEDFHDASLKKIAQRRKEMIDAIQRETEQKVKECKDENQRQKIRLEGLLKQAEVYNTITSPTAKPVEQKKSGMARRTRGGDSQTEEEEIFRNMKDGSGFITEYTQSPSYISGELKPYQIQALNWLIQRHDNGAGCILADEMGLGKTLETLSLIGHLMKERGEKGPFLIITPKSTTGNWMNEIKRWTPFAKAIFLGGVKEERQIHKEAIKRENFNILVTYYETAILEKAFIKKYMWNYVIIDEAHRIKNEKSLFSQVVRTFKTEHRLLLTGTPLQNNLHELWALLNFLMPRVFSSSENFDEWLNVDPERMKDAVAKLHKVLKPFLLRRMKEDVLKNLPPKKEIILFCPFSRMQKQWYKNVLENNLEVVIGDSKRKVRLLNLFMQLRKVCNHPFLFPGSEEGPPFVTDERIVKASGKMLLLDKLLQKLKETGHRVLLFSQMTAMLSIIEDYLVYRGYGYTRIDGNTDNEERIKSIDEFNKPNSPLFIFLLSTRAGGLGINLATADTVIIFDSDWNPQQDQQAAARAHRLGQTRPVTIYRLVTSPSVEERVVHRAQLKLRLDRLINANDKDDKRAKDKVSAEELLRMVQETADTFLLKGKDQAAEADSSKKIKSEEIEEPDIDIDINKIISEGEQRTTEMMQELDKEAGKGLFSLDDGSFSAPLSEEATIKLRQRNREKNEEKLDAIRLSKRTETVDYRVQSSRLFKRPIHQFKPFDLQFNPPRLSELLEKERILYETEDSLQLLSPEEEQEKNDLIAKNPFNTWRRQDVSLFVKAICELGKDKYGDIAKRIGKTTKEVKGYSDIFWERAKEFPSGISYLTQIKRAETKKSQMERRVNVLTGFFKSAVCGEDSIMYLLSCCLRKRKGSYTDMDNAILLNGMHEIGYGNWDALQDFLQNNDKSKMNFYIRTRDSSELAFHCNALLDSLEQVKAKDDELKSESLRQEKEKEKEKKRRKEELQKETEKEKRKKEREEKKEKEREEKQKEREQKKREKEKKKEEERREKAKRKEERKREREKEKERKKLESHIKKETDASKLFRTSNHSSIAGMTESATTTDTKQVQTAITDFMEQTPAQVKNLKRARDTQSDNPSKRSCL